MRGKMGWSFSVFDAVQFMIPAACFFLLLAVNIAYFFLYGRFQEALYKAGLIISFCALWYVLFEFLVIVCGWTGTILLGRMFHRLGQLAGAYFSLCGYAFLFLPDGPGIPSE